MAMRLEASTELPVSTDSAFAFLADPANDPAWCGPVKLTELTAGEPRTVGATYRFTEGFGNQVAEGTIEILELEPPHRVAVRTRTPQRRYVVTYELQPTADGCRLTQTTQPSFRGVPGPLMRLFFPAIRGQMRRQFRALRAVLVERDE